MAGDWDVPTLSCDLARRLGEANLAPPHTVAGDWDLPIPSREHGVSIASPLTVADGSDVPVTWLGEANLAPPHTVAGD